MMQEDSFKTPRAGKKEWIGLAIIALPCIIYSMDLTILNLAVPKLSEDLKPTSAQLLWIVDIYGFLLAGLLITMGTLGDRIGRRKLLLIGAAAFGAASTLAAFSSTANMLIASRALLGVAGATLAPSTLSLIRNLFENPKERTLAIGVWIASFSAGGGLGPVIGGIILENYWWGAVFLINLPVMLLLLILGPVLLPEYRDPQAGRIDLASAVLSLMAILALVYGIKALMQQGVVLSAFFAISVGISFVSVFLRRQRKLPHPFLDLRLFNDRKFSASLGLYAMATFVAFGMFFFVAQYLQLVLGLSPLMAGLWGLFSFGGFIIGSLSAPALVKKMRPVFVMACGFAIAAIGFTYLLFVETETSSLDTLVTGLTLFSLGISLVFTLATDVVVGSAPSEKAGIASSLSETASELGGALGIAILGSIGALIYRNEMPNVVSHGEEIPSTSMDTLGGTVVAVSQLPTDQAEILLDMAKVSFTHGMHYAAGISAIISISMAILCVAILRKS